MIKTLSPDQQLRLAKAILESALEAAVRLNAIVRSNIEKNYEPLAPQHIKVDVETVHGAIVTLGEVLTGKVEFKPSATETTIPPVP